MAVVSLTEFAGLKSIDDSQSTSQQVSTSYFFTTTPTPSISK